MDYKVDDRELSASMFVSFVNQVWKGDYDIEQTKSALSKTLNITAYDNKKLVIGSKLLQLAKDNTPTMLYHM